MDPTPDIHSLFVVFNNKFFSGRLSCVELEWSVKMYQCAGICYSRRNQMGMACVIRLSEPLLKLRSRKDLVETLLHEMIHAWNFIRGIMEENGGHGQNFLGKMHEINRLAGTNISVYHTFHDEVSLYKKHWWRCDGVCKKRSPYFGFVKRTCNRAPGKNDKWWKQHEQSCGGTFIKVKEPEKPEKKTKSKDNDAKRKAIEPKPKSVKTSPGSDIRKFFKPTEKDDTSGPTSPINLNVSVPGSSSSNATGHTLGGKGSGRSRLLDMFQTISKKPEEASSLRKRKLSDENEVITINDSFSSPQMHTSIQDRIKNELKDDNDDDIIFIDDEFDDNFSPIVDQHLKEPKTEVKAGDDCHCPCCNKLIAVAKINDHLDQCLGI